jgi:hypothetical protein
MTLSLIHVAREEYRLATDGSRPFGYLVEPFFV